MDLIKILLTLAAFLAVNELDYQDTLRASNAGRAQNYGPSHTGQVPANIG